MMKVQEREEEQKEEKQMEPKYEKLMTFEGDVESKPNNLKLNKTLENGLNSGSNNKL